MNEAQRKNNINLVHQNFNLSIRLIMSDDSDSDALVIDEEDVGAENVPAPAPPIIEQPPDIPDTVHPPLPSLTSSSNLSTDNLRPRRTTARYEKLKPTKSTASKTTTANEPSSSSSSSVSIIPILESTESSIIAGDILKNVKPEMRGSKTKKREDDSGPIDWTKPVNVERRRVEEILKKITERKEQQKDAFELTEEEIIEIQPTVKPWVLKPGFNHKRDGKGFPGKLAAISKLRNELLDRVGRRLRSKATLNPLGSEVKLNPNLARDEEIKKELLLSKKTPPTAPQYPPKHSSKTFYTKSSGYGTTIIKPVVKPKTKTLKTPTPEPAKSRVSKSPSPKATTDNRPHTVPITKPPRVEPKPVLKKIETCCQSHFSTDESDENEKLLHHLVPALPLYKANGHNKCSEEESKIYFTNLKKLIKRLPDKWKLSVNGPSPILDNMKAVIPPNVNEEMRILTERGRKILIKGNNTILSDVIVIAYFAACREYCAEVLTRPDGRQQLLDMQFSMNGVMDKLIKIFRSGITLPPVLLKDFKIPRCRPVDVRCFDPDVINSDMFSDECERTTFAEFIGKKFNDPWRFHEGHVITFADGLGFKIGRSLNLKTFEVLLMKLLKKYSPTEHGNRLICWTEIDKLMKENPGGNFRQEEPSRSFVDIQTRIVEANAKVYVPICLEGLLQYCVAVAVPSFKRIELYIPEQPECTFDIWCQRFPVREKVKKVLKFLKNLFESIFQQWQLWSVGEKDWPSTLQPLESGFVEKYDEIEMSPIACAIFFENDISRDDIGFKIITHEDPEFERVGVLETLKSFWTIVEDMSI